ncbi:MULTISPECIES: PfkB family carbohydrate kinase [unclassified Kitasatospora]|uniref:1-phosphofructokinase family hexose kinase n=1 Tax=unclassified Kitasatospora TaxID=2633591 RepID=UPI003409BEBB
MNPTVDICCDIDHLVAVGKTRAEVRYVAAGGGGINVARGVARFGGRATAVHTAGQEIGRRLNRLLDEEGIDHLALGITGETREAFVLFETASRRSYHIVPRGPRLDDDEARHCLDLLERAAGAHRYVVASGSLPGGLRDDFYTAVARRVRGAGSRLLLDTSGPALRESLHEAVFLRRCNRSEASYLVGQGHMELHAPPLPGEPLSDAGAGDGMIAAIVTRLAEGDDPVGACALGVAAASASMLTPGTEPCDREVAESLRPAVRINRLAG